MRRLPGPASRPLGEGVKTPEAPVGLFRGWQRTQTQSSVRTLRSLRQQMDVWFCLMQESSAERHCCVTADPDQIKCAPSGARPGILCFSLDFDLHRCWPIPTNPTDIAIAPPQTAHLADAAHDISMAPTNSSSICRRGHGIRTVPRWGLASWPAIALASMRTFYSEVPLVERTPR